MDSGASMHMISRKDLNSAELETVTTSRSPTTVIAANGEVQLNEEAVVYVRELDIFLTMKVFEDTPAVLSLGKPCHEHGYSYEWINGQKPHLIKNGIRFSVIRKMSYQSWFLVYLQLLQARISQHPRLLQVRKLIIQITLQQSSQAKVWIDKYGQTRMGWITIPQSCQENVWKGKNGETRTLVKHQRSCYMNQPMWAAAHPGQDRRLHSRLQRATGVRSRGGIVVKKKTAPGSLSTGSPAGRTPPHGDGSMYSQANVRAGKVLRIPIRQLLSVIVDTEKVFREADGPVELVLGWTARGWNGVRPGCAPQKPDGERR